MMAKQSLMFSQEGVIVGTLFSLFFYGITELLPLLSFVIVNRKFVEVMDQRDNINQPAQEEENENLNEGEADENGAAGEEEDVEADANHL